MLSAREKHYVQADCQRLLIRLFDKASLNVLTHNNERDEKGREKFDKSVLNICQLLIKYSTNLSARGIIISAVKYGSLECIRTLLDCGAAIADDDEESNTALHHCFIDHCTFPSMYDFRVVSLIQIENVLRYVCPVQVIFSSNQTARQRVWCLG